MNKGIFEARAIFIILIFLFHAGVVNIGGTFGVAGFFILGGFCNYLGYNEKVKLKSFNMRGYLAHRLSKFYPLHWLLLVPSFISELFTGYSLVKSTIILFINALLLQSLIPLKEVYFSYTAVSWYLSDTVILICLFPSICRLVERLSTTSCSIVFVVFIAIEIVSLKLIPAEQLHYFLYINPFARVIDFSFGIFLAKLVKTLSVEEWLKVNGRKLRLVNRGGYLLIISGLYIISVLLVLAYNHLPGFTRYLSFLYWLPCSVIITGLFLFSNDNPFETLIQKFGAISFEFFMTHQLVMNALTKVIQNFSIGLQYPIVKILLDFVCALVLSILLHRYFTVPVTKKIKVIIN